MCSIFYNKETNSNQAIYDSGISQDSYRHYLATEKKNYVLEVHSEGEYFVLLWYVVTLGMIQ